MCLFSLFKFWPKGQWGPCNAVGSLRMAEQLLRLESKTFQFIYNILSFFYLIYWCPTANSELSLRRQGKWPNVNYCIKRLFICFDAKVTGGPHNEVEFLCLAERIVSFESGTFKFTCDTWSWKPLRFSRWSDQQKCHFKIF